MGCADTGVDKHLRRKQEDRTEEAKAVIRKSALELIAIQGYDLTTLSQISIRANYSRSLAHYHYGTKEALALELLDESIEGGLYFHGLNVTDATSGMDVIEHLVYQLEHSANRLSSLISGERSLEFRGLVLLTSLATISSNEKLREKIQKSNRIMAGRIVKRINADQERGVIRDDLDPEGAAAFYIGATWGLINEFFGEPKRHDRVIKGFETLKMSIQSWRR